MKFPTISPGKVNESNRGAGFRYHFVNTGFELKSSFTCFFLIRVAKLLLLLNLALRFVQQTSLSTNEIHYPGPCAGAPGSCMWTKTSGFTELLMACTLCRGLDGSGVLEC